MDFFHGTYIRLDILETLTSTYVSDLYKTKVFEILLQSFEQIMSIIFSGMQQIKYF